MLVFVFYHRLMKKIIYLLLFFCFLCGNSQACSLAMHNWELRFQYSIPIDGPIIPASEFSTLSMRFVPADISNILWVSNANAATGIAMLFKNALKKWTAGMKIIPTDQSDLAKNAIGSTTLLIEPNNYVIKIALFSDKFSNHRCKQLVILQEGRIKVALPQSKPPVAEQYYGRAWVSIFFYDQPIPGKILSIAASPVADHLQELFVDFSFVEMLMRNNLVQRRTENYQTPYVDGFPAIE